MTKRCSKCKMERHIQMFDRNRTQKNYHKDGRDSECKICRRAEHKKWASDNLAAGRMTKDEAKALARDWNHGVG